MEPAWFDKDLDIPLWNGVSLYKSYANPDASVVASLAVQAKKVCLESIDSLDGFALKRRYFSDLETFSRLERSNKTWENQQFRARQGVRSEKREECRRRLDVENPHTLGRIEHSPPCGPLSKTTDSLSGE